MNLFGHDILAGCEIIEGAKRVLQVLECRKSCLSPFEVSGKEAHEELAGVAQVFGSHAEAVPLLRAKIT